MVLHALLLAVAVAALAAAALRVVSLGIPSGLERGVGAAVVAVATAAAEALVLGWLGFGMDAFVLTAAAALTWVAAALACPAPELPPSEELGARWSALAPRGRLAAGALTGAALAALAAWVLRPRLGFDTFLYHLPLAVTWIQEGDPGAVNQVTTLFPVGAYPSFDELTLAWSAGIARSFVPFSIWPWGLLLLTGAGGWLGLRALGVARLAAALALAAVVVSQQVAGWQATGASTDPASLAWLVATAGLCAASLGRGGRPPRPVLLAPALLGGAVAIGTKPTIAPLVAIVLVATAVVHRAELRAIVRPLVSAAAAGALVGGWWYARDLVLYGSPLWPFYATPWGTPLPPGPRAHTFLGSLRPTLDAIGTDYLEIFGGSLLLIVAALLAPLLDRRRLVLGASAVTALAVIAWMVTPNTGLTQSYVVIIRVGTLSTVRYLVGGVAAAALVVALVTRRRGAARWIAYAVLATGAGINVAQTFDLGHFAVPSPLVLLAGAALGALAAAGLGAAAGRIRLPPLGRTARGALAVAAILAAGGAGLAAVTPRYLDRLAVKGLAAEPNGPLLRWFLEQPGFRDGTRSIAALPLRQSILAGPRLEHRVGLPAHPSCAELRRRARAGWVVLWGAHSPGARALLGHDPLRCFTGLRPAYRDAVHDVYADRG
jgi:hypothetical protein